MSKIFELVLFDKYLIRTDNYQFILSEVKYDCNPIVKIYTIEKENEIREVRDYSNFNKETYHSTLSMCLHKIKHREILNGDVQSLDDLLLILNNIDNKIDNIRKRLS